MVKDWTEVLFHCSFENILPFPNPLILDFSKLKELAGDNFKFDINGRKFSKWVENFVGRGEIALNEQFLLSPQCFQNTWTADMLKPGLVWERVKRIHPLSNHGPNPSDAQ